MVIRSGHPESAVIHVFFDLSTSRKPTRQWKTSTETKSIKHNQASSNPARPSLYVLSTLQESLNTFLFSWFSKLFWVLLLRVSKAVRQVPAFSQSRTRFSSTIHGARSVGIRPASRPSSPAATHFKFRLIRQPTSLASFDLQ